MSVCHYLFWKEKDKIIAVLNSGDSPEIIKFGGYTAVHYTKDYWENWQEYAGFLKDDFIDFCFVFDDECPQISEYLKVRECPENECVWDSNSIQKVADMMGVTNLTEIYSKEGNRLIAKTGYFRGAGDSNVKHLIAVYRNSKDLICQEDLENIEFTPFISDMLTKLKCYDEQ